MNSDKTLIKKVDPNKLPEHIAIIMDGNGRWAKAKNLPRTMGHRAGVRAVRSIVEACAEIGIRVLTLYAFSTENWSRPKKEVSLLMGLLKVYLQKELATMMKNNIRLLTIGASDRLPLESRNMLMKVINKTSANTGMNLVLALNYGSREEIVQAARAIIKSGSKEITEKIFCDYLYTKGLPDPDLLIRTSGEMRVSNFLLWQAAYSELYVTETLWPDFTKEHLYRALIEYQSRERRFGGV